MKKNRCNYKFKKINLNVKNGFKKKEKKPQNTADFPVINVGNSPQIVYMDVV